MIYYAVFLSGICIPKNSLSFCIKFSLLLYKGLASVIYFLRAAAYSLKISL